MMLTRLVEYAEREGLGDLDFEARPADYDLRIDAIDYATDFEQNLDGWESEGWLLTDNQLIQPWLLQVMTFDRDTLVAVEQIAVADDGSAEIATPTRQRGQRAVLAISALAPVSTEPAHYEISVR